MDEAGTLLSLFGDEDDFDLGGLGLLAQQSADQPMTDAEIEALMREHLGLPSIDTAGAIRAAEAGKIAVRPSDGDEDDFSEEEWAIVKTMRKLCLDAISPGTSPRARARSVEWLFVRGTEEGRHGVSFHLACEMLRSRFWVIQALIQHFWCLRGILPGQLPFLADPVPESIQSEAILHGWDAGMQIVAAAWSRPGVLDSELVRILGIPQVDYEQSLTALVEAGVVGLRMGQVYVTSRPATFRRSRQAVSWSNSFLGE